MKALVLMIFIFLVCFSANCQSSSAPKKRPCKTPVVYHYAEGKGQFESLGELKPMAPSERALSILNQLLMVLNLDLNNETGIHLFSSDSVSSTVSFIEDNQPYILYNNSFFDKFYEVDSDNWQLKFVFAHELGHHLNGHTSNNEATLRRETAADRFAGWLLGLLRADEQATLKWLGKVNPWTDGIHPTQRERIASAKEGFASASALMNLHNMANENVSYLVDHRSGPFSLSTKQEGAMDYKTFNFEKLDVNKDFRIEIKIRSISPKGSATYGLGWNFNSKADFQIFTLHDQEYKVKNQIRYTIGRGNCALCREKSWSSYRDGSIDTNEGDSNILSISKKGDKLIFYINNSQVWVTNTYYIRSNKFAFWVANNSSVTCDYIKAFQ